MATASRKGSTRIAGAHASSAFAEQSRADGRLLENSVTWIDAHGTIHDSGWPACLEPAHPGFARRSHKLVRFRFADVSADTEYLSYRPVVMVDCQPPAA